MRRQIERRSERGVALLVGLTLILILLGVTGTLVALMVAESNAHVDRLMLEETRRTADAALSIACGRMTGAKPVPAAMSGTVSSTSSAFQRGVPWSARVSQCTSDNTYYKVSVAAGSSTSYRLTQAYVQVPQTVPPVPNGIGGAIISNDPSWIQASSVTVDGTNHSAFGGALIGSGNSNSVVNGGTFTPKGTIIGPVVNNAAWGASMGQMANTAGRLINVADASLTDPAQNPTYFTTQAALTAWVSSHKDANGYIPNTSVIYYTFDGQDPTSLPMDPNKAYIVVNHHPSASGDPVAINVPNQGTANAGFVAGSFTGILIIDNFDHMQHGPINGTLAVLGDYSGKMKIQGGATITYSTGAIGLALQGVGQSGNPLFPKIVAYVEAPSLTDADVVNAIRDCSFVVGSSASNAGGTPTGWRTPPQ